jgi:hypothetical protein
MEHRGVEYRIIRGIQRGFWKWSVETKTGTKSGTSNSKDEAMNAARRSIDTHSVPKGGSFASLNGQRAEMKSPPAVSAACESSSAIW